MEKETLRDYILRSRINLSKRLWNQLNDKWNENYILSGKSSNKIGLIYNNIKEIPIESESGSESGNDRENLLILSISLNIGLSIMIIFLKYHSTFK